MITHKLSRRQMRRKLHPYVATAAACPACHQIRGIFTRDRLGQLVCIPCRNSR